MSSGGARQRFPGKNKNQDTGINGKKKTLTEEEAVNKASSKWIGQLGLALLLSLAVPPIVLILIPSPIQPKEFPPLTPPASFEGPLSINDDLSFCEKLYENELIGPESLVFDGDNIYTGTMDGWVNQLKNGEIRRLVRFGNEPCGGFNNENTCGRPLGMKMDKDGQLVVIDAYFGVFRVNVTTGEYETLYKSTTPINGKTPKMLNDVDIDKQGRIYFTDSSSKWHRNQFQNIVLEGDDSGRLLMYDPKTKQTTQLADYLIFPNGVQLTPDHDAVLVAELGRARIMKFDFKHRKLSIWADGLPGFPDNIRYDGDSQTYWVALAAVRYLDNFSPLEYILTSSSWLRATLAKVVSVSNLPTLTSFVSQFSKTVPKVAVVELDKQGAIISSLQDKAEKVLQAISEVHLHNGVFYFGSYRSSFIARLDWKNMVKV